MFKFLVLWCLTVSITVWPQTSLAQTAYCPDPDIPWTIFLDGDTLTIQRMSRAAICTRTNGDVFACVEEYPYPLSDSEYDVTARVLSNGILSFQPPLEESNPMLLPPCDPVQ